MKKYLFLLLVLPLSAFAISEENYLVNWQEKVFPHYLTLNSSEFHNAQGMTVRFHYTLKSGATKTIVILPGRGEPAAKYAEVIYDIDSPKVNIFVMDHQGQGESDRMLEDTHKGHVKSFQNFVADVSQFMQTIVLPETKGTEHLLLAHSMGGAISVHYLAQNPGVFKKAFLNAPMLKLNTKPYAEIIAKIYATFLVKTGKQNDYAPGKGPYVIESDSFEKNVATHSEARHAMSKGLFRDFPALIVGGPSVSWVHSALKATSRIQNLGPKIKIPVLMLQSGHDEYVKTERQDSFCDKAPDCEKILYPQAFHEILMEKDEVRNDAMKRLKAFFGI